MNEISAAFAKLAGIQKALQFVLNADRGYAGRPRDNFPPSEVRCYFDGTLAQLEVLRRVLPELFGDFPEVDPEPRCAMSELAAEPMHYYRAQLEALARAVAQILETRAHSELPTREGRALEPRVFISHGPAEDWREVQAFIEKDMQMRTLELAQQANLGRTVLQKLEQESARCTSAVIVMTGDDADAEGNLRARENVLHEIGYFQGKFGLAAVCLLHEEGTNIPSNIHGLVYIPFPKGSVATAFGALMRELKGYYRR